MGRRNSFFSSTKKDKKKKLQHKNKQKERSFSISTKQEETEDHHSDNESIQSTKSVIHYHKLDYNHSVENSKQPLISPDHSELDLSKNDDSPKNERKDLIQASGENPTATLELDLIGNVTYLSKSWESFVGTNLKKIINKPISRIILGTEEDKNVFSKATQIMIKEDASYRVRFVVARNEVKEEDDGSLTSQEDVTLNEINASPSHSNSDADSDISTNDEFIELEGQGLVTHDLINNEPVKTMWLIRPYIERNLSIELPGELQSILGFGCELFAHYLKNITEAEITNESIVPLPDHVLCNICEQQVPSWWLERHSEICYTESKAESDLQIAHENVLEHRDLLNAIVTSKVVDYKGMRIPINPDALTSNSNPHSILRFPFRTLHSLTELCDQTINFDPVDFESDDEKKSVEGTSENGESRMEEKIKEIFEWGIPRSNDKTINLLIEDTEFFCKQKAEAALRVVHTQKFHEQLKKEVDILVLQAVHDTVSKVNDHLNGVDESYSTPTINESATNSPNPIYSYMDKDINPLNSSINNTLTKTPIFPSPLRNNSGSIHIQRQGSSSSIVSDRRSFYNVEAETLNDSFKELSLLDPSKNASSNSLIKRDLPSNNIQASPRRPYSPGPLNNSPLTSIQKNNKSQNNFFINCNDSASFISKPNTANSSPLLLGNDTNNNNHNPSNVFLDFSRKDSDELSNSLQYSKPPLSPLMISSFPSGKQSTPGIKDYEIIKPISKGAFGSVYLARKKVNGEYFAIKVLKKSDMVAKNQVTNVKSERAIMMAQSNSPFVAKLFSTFQTRSYLFLVMEYLNGGDCASLLKVLGTLPENWAKRYVAEMIVGVDYLHQKGIVHRDLKPDNFLIDSRGHLKLTDFGLSRMGLVGRQFRHQKMTSTSSTYEPEPFQMPAGNIKKSSPIIPIINEHKRSISYASSISSSDSNSIANSSASFLINTNNDSNNNKNFNSPTTAWFENLMKQEKSNSSLTGSPRSTLLNNSNSEMTNSPVLRPLHKSNSQTSFALLDDDISLTNSNPKNLALFNPSSSAETRRFVGTPDYLAPETIKGLGQNEASDWWSLGCILFEFLFGYPPFHADNINQVFENILSGKIDWNEYSEEVLNEICSKLARDLISKLLTVDPLKRLGNNGANEIKSHPFFENIHWEKLWEEEASFIPSVDNAENTDYFDGRGAEMDDDLYETETGGNLQLENDKQLQELFKSDSYTSEVDNWLNDNKNDMETNDSNSVISSNSHLQSPSMIKRERRKSTRLNESLSEFGSFQYRNITALEKANKDVINRLKSEHMDQHKNSISSSSSDSGARSRGLSFSSTITGSPYPIKPAPPISAGNNSISSPSKPAFSGGHSHSFSSSYSSASPIVKLDRNALYNAEDVISRHSSGRASPIASLNSKINNSDTNKDCDSDFAVPVVNPKSISKFSPILFNQQHNSPTLNPVAKNVIYGKSFTDFSPSSSDNEDSRNSAILRIKRRRSRRVGSMSSNHTTGTNKLGIQAHKLSLSNTGEDVKFNSVDVLLCEAIPIFRFSARKMLEKLGCNIVEVNSGDEIIRRVSGQVKFDLIFTTIRGEKLNISNVVKLIKVTNNINSSTPIIALTSYYREAMALKIFDDVIEKPATQLKFEAVLTKYCSNKYELISDAESIVSEKTT